MKCNTPADLILRGSIDGSIALERLLHAFLTPFHHKGEWFRADEAVLKFIDGLEETKSSRSPQQY